MSDMMRVSKKQPCPACGKFDWCLLGKSVALCMRVSSPREKQMKDGSIGWIHPLNGVQVTIIPRKEVAPLPPEYLGQTWERWKRSTMPWQIAKLARELGVTQRSLELLGVAFRDRETAGFQMRDHKLNIVGIRLRARNGMKFSLKGGHPGLFIPESEPSEVVFLPEGPTNTAAALTLGAYAIGRPSCNGSVHEVVATIKELKIKRAVILADTDVDRVMGGKTIPNPGATGAMALADHLPIPSCTLLLPFKDMRDFVKSGATRDTLDYLVKQCVWRRPS